MTDDRTSDPTFPSLHGRPARGWVNDPNGLARVGGRYHVFFQHNPDVPRHEAVSWGHASSADLVTWTQEPVALRPRHGQPDQAGCWTGCVTLDEGVPTAVYSGVEDHSGASRVLLARSGRDLRSWTHEDRPAVGMPGDPAVTDVRDPFLFHAFGRRYAVQGAGSPGGAPGLLVYAADDLTDWQELGSLLSADDPIAAEVAPANIWECPNLVQVDDRWLLVLSLWRSVAGRHELAGVRYLVGDLVLEGAAPRFVPAAGGWVDTGPCFYAPQLLADEGRVLMWAWSWERDRDQDVVDAAGWAGCLTFPRVLSLAGDLLVSTPAPELAALRRSARQVEPGAAFVASAFELELPAGAASLHLEHADGSRERVADWTVPGTPLSQPRLLVDGSMVEVFPGTPTTLTTRAYPGVGSRWRVDTEAPSPVPGHLLARPAAEPV